MKIHILDQTGDTVLEITDKTMEEAERIIRAHWKKGSSLITEDGVRLDTMDDVKEHSAKGEERAFFVPRLAGG